MTITGMVRVRNGQAHLAHCLHSMLRVCGKVVVMNDHSTDRTVDILNSFPVDEVAWFTSPFRGLNEARDKTFLLKAIKNYVFGPVTDWILAMDADEVLLDPQQLRDNLIHRRHLETGAQCPVLAYRILTLWDRPDQLRVDGIYGDLWRASIFRLDSTDGVWQQLSEDGPNLHCGSVPTDVVHLAVRCEPEVRVLHYGSMLREDRIAKYNWYLTRDDQHQQNEDGYRHAVQGDLSEYPADAVYRHGGPLRLQEWRL